MLKKLLAKKFDSRRFFFVSPVRSLINLWFLTNQVEKTDKQTKLRWLVVDQCHMAMPCDILIACDITVTSLIASPCDSVRLLTILVIAILIAYPYGKQFKTAYACTFLPAASILGKNTATTTTTATTETTKNNATATTVLDKWKSNLWRRRFRWNQSHRKFGYLWK